MRRFWGFLQGALLILLVLAPWRLVMAQAPDAVQLLRNMTEAFHSLNYDGVFVHSEASKMNSMRHTSQRTKWHGI